MRKTSAQVVATRAGDTGHRPTSGDLIRGHVDITHRQRSADHPEIMLRPLLALDYEAIFRAFVVIAPPHHFLADPHRRAPARQCGPRHGMCTTFTSAIVTTPDPIP